MDEMHDADCTNFEDYDFKQDTLDVVFRCAEDGIPTAIKELQRRCKELGLPLPDFVIEKC